MMRSGSYWGEGMGRGEWWSIDKKKGCWWWYICMCAGSVGSSGRYVCVYVTVMIAREYDLSTFSPRGRYDMHHCTISIFVLGMGGKPHHHINEYMSSHLKLIFRWIVIIPLCSNDLLEE